MMCIRSLIRFSLIFLLSLLFNTRSSFGQYTDTEKSEAGQILEKMAEVFKGKIDEQYSMIAQIRIVDTDESWHVVVEEGQRAFVGEGPHEQAFLTFATTTDTLRLMYHGKLDAMTAASKTKGSDPAPLDLEFAEGSELTPETKAKFYTFIQHFFNPSVPEKKLLGRSYSRPVHGAHVIALYYHQGFRSAWYLLNKGEKLNETGDRNPFPQAFIIVEGEGLAKIGDHVIQVKAEESYYIPPDSDHVVWTESDKPLILVWLAWGEGA